MKRKTKLQDLLDRAYRRTAELYFNELGPGEVELIWKRWYGGKFSSVQVRTFASLAAGLQVLLAEEDAFRQRQDHGAGCACDDCCISRVDLGRAVKNERV